VDTEIFTGDDGRFAVTLEHPGPYRVEFSTSSDEFGWSERETRDVFASEARRTSIRRFRPAPPQRSWDENGRSRRAAVRGRVVVATVRTIRHRFHTRTSAPPV